MGRTTTTKGNSMNPGKTHQIKPIIQRKNKDHRIGSDNKVSKVSTDIFLQPPSLQVQVQRKNSNKTTTDLGEVKQTIKTSSGNDF